LSAPEAALAALIQQRLRRAAIMRSNEHVHSAREKAPNRQASPDERIGQESVRASALHTFEWLGLWTDFPNDRSEVTVLARY